VEQQKPISVTLSVERKLYSLESLVLPPAETTTHEHHAVTTMSPFASRSKAFTRLADLAVIALLVHSYSFL